MTRDRSSSRGCKGWLPALAGLVGAVLWACPAAARKNGIISADCTGCHKTEGASIEVTPSPLPFEPGDDVTFTVTVRSLVGTAGVGGVSISQPATGQLHTIAGEGLTLVTGSGLTHSQPKAAVGGVVTFRFGWRAPAEPGGLVFNIGALAGDGNGRNTGDAGGMTRFLTTFGCEPALYYADLDQDGHGTELFDTSIGCAGAAVPMSFSLTLDDCNDNDPTVFPSAVEKCNKKDDDCNGEVDENAELVELWPDEDGDGYYKTQTGTAVIGCSGMPNLAAEPGDCSPSNAAVHPGATEVCNLIDDNCDGRQDERMRPQCGEGFCRRESYDCDPAHCTPGEPSAEKCNYLDDDCNGEVDEGDLCGAGSACLAGMCVVSEGIGGGGVGGQATGAGGASTGGGAGEGTGGSGGGVALGGGAGVGSGGVAPGAGGTEQGATGSGASGGSAGAGAAPEPATNVDTDAGGGCALGGTERSSGAGLGAVLTSLGALWLRLRRRRR